MQSFEIKNINKIQFTKIEYSEYNLLGKNYEKTTITYDLITWID